MSALGITVCCFLFNPWWCVMVGYGPGGKSIQITLVWFWMVRLSFVEHTKRLPRNLAASFFNSRAWQGGNMASKTAVALQPSGKGEQSPRSTTSVEKQPPWQVCGEAVAQPFSASQAKRVLRSLSLQHWQICCGMTQHRVRSPWLSPRGQFTTVCGLRDHALVQFLTGHGAFLEGWLAWSWEDGTCTTCGVPYTTLHALRSCQKMIGPQQLKRALGWDNLPGLAT
ncbi:hypothetical protein LSTR_LSTR015425 [Laodelphax striatellus]|uniref:Uncharacterized protein n=1 Tax=Laodelphax striatellus TaxID=195883 RepID=A0A482X7U4_LAOST|nr:hypothetical protein LSTR_LSTR015425 [Laodelphax striatellus]